MKLTLHHTAISVRSIDQSLKFYEALGFVQVHRYDDDEKTNVHLKLNNYYVEMFCYRVSADKPPVDFAYANDLPELGVKHIALATNDTRATLAELQAKGLAPADTVLNEWDDVSFFFIKDPDGVWVEIIKDDRY